MTLIDCLGFPSHHSRIDPCLCPLLWGFDRRTNRLGIGLKRTDTFVKNCLKTCSVIACCLTNFVKAMTFV